MDESWWRAGPASVVLRELEEHRRDELLRELAPADPHVLMA